MKYRKRPALTEATQWFKNGDHPEDESTPIDKPDGSAQLTEGKVVGYFRSLNIPGGRFCPICGNPMSKHGMLDGEHAVNPEEVVCPGDYIVTRVKGRFYRIPRQEFETMYEPYIPTPQDRDLA